MIFLARKLVRWCSSSCGVASEQFVLYIRKGELCFECRSSSQPVAEGVVLGQWQGRGKAEVNDYLFELAVPCGTTSKNSSNLGAVYLDFCGRSPVHRISTVPRSFSNTAALINHDSRLILVVLVSRLCSLFTRNEEPTKEPPTTHMHRGHGSVFGAVSFHG